MASPHQSDHPRRRVPVPVELSALVTEAGGQVAQLIADSGWDVASNTRVIVFAGSTVYVVLELYSQDDGAITVTGVITPTPTHPVTAALRLPRDSVERVAAEHGRFQLQATTPAALSVSVVIDTTPPVAITTAWVALSR